MLLVVAATDFEMDHFRRAYHGNWGQPLLCGVGPVESCLALTRYLEKNGEGVEAVFNFGVAGLYPQQQRNSAGLLDICLAKTETMGDLGICFPQRMDDLPAALTPGKTAMLDSGLLHGAEVILTEKGVDWLTGNFITVNGVSGTLHRGEILRSKHDGLCENMEGAALARVCVEYSLPLLEMRCVSNLVEDRNPSGWRLKEACELAGKTAALLVLEMEKRK